MMSVTFAQGPFRAPWLAGMFVAPAFRGRGLAAQLIAAVEREARAAAVARLRLYTNTAERVYARAGWRTVEYIMRSGKPYALMQRELGQRRMRGHHRRFSILRSAH